MFVAFELQIGLEAQVNGLHGDHVSYEEGGILNAQQLLKKYKDAHKNLKEVGTITTPVLSTLSEKSERQDDMKLVMAVLEGNFSNCKYCALDQKEIDREGAAPISPERLCLNNKRLNTWADQKKA
eukprot:4511822-Ditylum_brightwellii.AAC.1